MRDDRLNEYCDELLILFAKQKNDCAFDERVRSILCDRFSRWPYANLYINYLNSEGIKKLAIGDALCDYLSDDYHYVEPIILEKMLEDLSFERLVQLKQSENPLVKQIVENSHILSKKKNSLKPIIDEETSNVISWQKIKKMRRKKEEKND